MLSCNIANYIIKRQSERYIIIVIINSNKTTSKIVCKIQQSILELTFLS